MHIPVNPPALSAPRFLQVALLGSALALSVGSSGTAKPTAKSSVILKEPQCSAERPPWFPTSIDGYELSCRYNGGILRSKTTKQRRVGKITCPKGTFLHALSITCEGAEFNPALIPSRKSTAARTPTTAVEKTDIAKALLEALNGDRAERNLATLRWSDKLATFAAEWVAHIAKLGVMRPIASDRGKTGQGEEIWIGPASSLSYEKIVQEWGRNKQLDAATLVGCAASLVGDTLIVVCRSWPPGR
jgi:hypothetical protein